MFRKKNVEPTPYELAILNVREAAANLRRAQANFNNAIPDYFDVANTELTAAHHRFDCALREANELKPKDEEPLSKNPFIRKKNKALVNPQGDITF